jgi:hypothetical protein
MESLQDREIKQLLCSLAENGDDPDSFEFDEGYTEVDYLQSTVFGFCGCGMPERNLRYILSGLEHVFGLSILEKEDKAFPGGEENKYFFFYWADKEGLTEHGSSVPGWLTERGKTVLTVLRALNQANKLQED